MSSANRTENLRHDNDTHLRKAKASAAAKLAKYGDHCVAAGIKPVPFVMYTNGTIHEDGIKLLQKIATHGSETRRIPQGTLFRYYKKLLSVTLAKQIAHTVHTKATAASARIQNLNGNLFNSIRLENMHTIKEGESRTFVNHNIHSRET